ncbi:YetF domain-containing protein [Paraclostridium bifermentans]|uniref:YetF domain-containing protein n=1 Tax=Paraclostridium bifermentans TaxID=1490 RepID=UPI0011DCCAB8
MFIVLIRTIFLYFLVILVMRLMGKRQIGELQPYEFVITIMISDLAALPMQDTRLPLILGIIPIITLLFIKTILTQLQLKSQFTRKILEGEPCILVCKGKINYKALKKQQINLDELMEELRLAGYFDLNEIEYAILENNGQLSFLTSQSSSSSASVDTSCSSNTQPLSSGDEPQASTQSNSSNTQNTNSNASGSESSSKNNKKSNSTGSSGSNSSSSSSNSNSSGNSNSTQVPRLPIIYVLDGHVNNNALTTSGKNKVWIEHELKKHHINSIKDVLIAMIDTQGKFVYQLYDKNDNVKGAKK